MYLESDGKLDIIGSVVDEKNKLIYVFGVNEVQPNSNSSKLSNPHNPYPNHLLGFSKYIHIYVIRHNIEFEVLKTYKLFQTKKKHIVNNFKVLLKKSDSMENINYLVIMGYTLGSNHERKAWVISHNNSQLDTIYLKIENFFTTPSFPEIEYLEDVFTEKNSLYFLESTSVPSNKSFFLRKCELTARGASMECSDLITIVKEVPILESIKFKISSSGKSINCLDIFTFTSKKVHV